MQRQEEAAAEAEVAPVDEEASPLLVSGASGVRGRLSRWWASAVSSGGWPFEVLGSLLHTILQTSRACLNSLNSTN